MYACKSPQYARRHSAGSTSRFSYVCRSFRMSTGAEVSPVDDSARACLSRGSPRATLAHQACATRSAQAARRPRSGGAARGCWAAARLPTTTRDPRCRRRHSGRRWRPSAARAAAPTMLLLHLLPLRVLRGRGRATTTGIRRQRHHQPTTATGCCCHQRRRRRYCTRERAHSGAARSGSSGCWCCCCSAPTAASPARRLRIPPCRVRRRHHCRRRRPTAGGAAASTSPTGSRARAR